MTHERRVFNADEQRLIQAGKRSEAKTAWHRRYAASSASEQQAMMEKSRP